METMIAQISLPAIGCSYDFQLPALAQVGDVVRELVRILESTEQNLSFDEEMPMLCLSGEGRPLPQDATLAELGLRDGAKLLLL